MPTNQEISEAADKAADYIETLGHEKYVFQEYCSDGKGAVCIRGALNLAAGDNPFNCEAGDAYAHVVANYMGMTGAYAGTCDLPNWNNQDERTPEEVIGVLRDVATKYRSDEMTVSSK